MSTPSMIARKVAGGYLCIYVHNDGYPNRVGQSLLDFFNTEEDATALIGLGDCSGVAGRWDLGMVEAYHRDRGETWERVRPLTLATLEEATRLYNPMYHYVWEDGKWTAFKGNSVVAWATEKS